MWPGLWVASIVPILAFATIIDAFISWSAVLARVFRIRRELSLICLLISLLTFLVFALDVRLNDLDFNLRGNLVQRATITDARMWFDRHIIENRILALDAVLIFGSLAAVSWIALRWRGSLRLWLPLAVLGNVGAVFWLVMNRRSLTKGHEKITTATPPGAWDIRGDI